MGIEYDFDLHLEDIAGRVEASLIPAAMKAMDGVIRPAVAAGTPVETGHLVGSEDVRPTDDGAELFIPGPYARRQHYELTYRHTTGHALYLELPMVQQADAALAVVAQEIRDAI